jgi:hypothetical protein
MSLTYGLQTARDLLEKLRRDAKLLDDEVSSDRFFNFVITGYSLIKWVEKDPSVPVSAKTKPEIDGLYKNHWLKVCGDIANASKHFTLDLKKRKPITSGANVSTGWGCGRWGKGGWGVGEEQIDIVLNDGTAISGLNFITNVLKEWEQFFKKHNI